MSDAEHRVLISYGAGRRGIPSARRLRAFALLGLSQSRAPSALAVRVVEADEGRALNRQFRGRDYATNVLSFPALELPRPDTERRWLGDVVLCAPILAEEARQQGKPLAHHYAHLMIHGVLHLLGERHDQPRAALRMEAIERHLLASIGIPDPYAPR